jgi:glycerol-3-phosphate dehydrogenase
VSGGDSGQFPGWPMTVRLADNDGREVRATAGSAAQERGQGAVVQVADESTGEILVYNSPVRAIVSSAGVWCWSVLSAFGGIPGCS